MASSTIQSGLNPLVLERRPSRETILSLTELSVSWEDRAVQLAPHHHKITRITEVNGNLHPAQQFFTVS